MPSAKSSVTEYIENLEHVDLLTITEEDMKCPVCWCDFGETDNNIADVAKDISVSNILHTFRSLPFPICDPSNDAVKLDCGHVFGKSCLAASLEIEGSCPLCRHPIDIYANLEERRRWVVLLRERQIKHWGWDELNLCSHRVIIFPNYMTPFFKVAFFKEMRAQNIKHGLAHIHSFYGLAKPIITMILGQYAFVPAEDQELTTPTLCHLVTKEIIDLLQQQYNGQMPIPEECIGLAMEYAFRVLSLSQSVNLLEMFVRHERYNNPDLDEGIFIEFLSNYEFLERYCDGRVITYINEHDTTDVLQFRVDKHRDWDHSLRNSQLFRVLGKYSIVMQVMITFLARACSRNRLQNS